MTQVTGNYFGGKGGSGVYQAIINRMRPHDCYIEPFLGGGSVMLRKRAAKLNIGCELDPVVLEKWRGYGGAGHITVHGQCGFDFLAGFDYAAHGRVLVYCDPPYPLDSRKSQQKRYAHELTDSDHLRLLQLLKSLPTNVDVLISTYHNQIYRRELRAWHCTSFQARTRRGTATELLYANYAHVGKQHDVSFAGGGYRERERIKKKVRRWVAKYQAMPPDERQAILQAIFRVGIDGLSADTAIAADTAKYGADHTANCGADPTTGCGVVRSKAAVSDISPRQITLFDG